MAVIFPLVILVTVMVVQASMWYYARNIALAAARSGVAAGRGYQQSPQDGKQRADEVLAQTAGTSLLEARASASATADRLTITVTGHAPSLLPFFGGGISISQSASGPREHWTNR
ncbi:TadE family protein [Kitasatospora xanthocidica]|uniref:TadE family protein n=1 Tax=Kitasatospora xanthocidica TaxID=83382 RepID=UPI0036F06D4F